MRQVRENIAIRPMLAAAAIGIAGALGWAQTGEAGSVGSPVAAAHVSKTVRVAADDTGHAEARCPRGYVATGGGVHIAVEAPLTVDYDAPSPDGRGWQADVSSYEDDGGASYSFRLTAVCARGSVAFPAEASSRAVRRRGR